MAGRFGATATGALPDVAQPLKNVVRNIADASAPIGEFTEYRISFLFQRVHLALGFLPLPFRLGERLLRRVPLADDLVERALKLLGLTLFPSRVGRLIPLVGGPRHEGEDDQDDATRRPEKECQDASHHKLTSLPVWCFVRRMFFSTPDFHTTNAPPANRRTHRLFARKSCTGAMASAAVLISPP